MTNLRAVAFSVAVSAATAMNAAAAQTLPVPQPFPGAGTPAAAPASPARPAESRAPAPLSAPAPTVAPQAVLPVAGAPVYPTAEFLEVFDAGSGQKYELYGTNAAFAEIVAYYRTVLKNGGRELFRAPATHQFDLGRFQAERMAFPPSVVVKDYTWNNSPGYLFVSGTTEKRYRTIIQIVAPGPTP